MESEVYKMGAGRFAMELIFRYSGTWLLILSLVGLLGVIAGVAIDMRWFLIGMLLIFVISPMLLAFMYYYYGLSRGCYVNTMSHKIVIEEEGIRIKFIQDDKGSEIEREMENPVPDRANRCESPLKDEFFKYSSMSAYKIGNSSVTIPVKTESKGFIWIPAEAFRSDAEMSEALLLIDNKIMLHKG